MDPSASASALTPAAPASASATLTKGDASGFDHLSPFDEVCASAFNTPYAPYLDTPDQTPTQTPLFDSVASEDLCSLQLDDLWAPSAVATLPAAPTASITNDSSFAQTSSVLDFDLSFVSSASAPLSSTTQSGQAAQDDVQTNARLQAENALLDFVLFDDIAFPSPISTFSTPMTTTITSPSSANSKEFETNELAMQLVAAAAASMSSQTALTSTQTSPLTTDTADVLGSLFSDVDLSPIMENTTSPTATAAASLFGSDFILDCTANAVKSSFSFDFGNDGLEIRPSPMISAGMTSPPLDMSIFLSLCSQNQQPQQQQQQSSLFPSPLLSAAATSALSQTAAPAENPLKRKAGEVQQAGEESPRQFVCAICGRAFSRLFNLNTHERTHDRSKARLFACPEQGCTKTFTRRNDCQRHQISIHKVTDIYSCNKCPKRFSSREELRSHTDRNCQEDH
ncbi:hypothetical protein BG015_007860 [Linnemannia schmuckeri]|uniref:C2H2-type domain-containing protein n=1 Tax=Linnemannia schmuckeri TaxID=64567 RepID=A0A9P5VB34_9FUNG|nr:hypothetical protein BG015_007860 [Linnemannia schmuckeri]